MGMYQSSWISRLELFQLRLKRSSRQLAVPWLCYLNERNGFHKIIWRTKPVQKSTSPRKKVVLVNLIAALHRIPMWCTSLLFLLAYDYCCLFCSWFFVCHEFCIYVICNYFTPFCKLRTTWLCSMLWCFLKICFKESLDHMYKRNPYISLNINPIQKSLIYKNRICAVG